jgi:FHA domain
MSLGDQLSTDNQDTEKLVRLDEAALASARNAANNAYLTCPQCGQPCKLSDPTCSHCGLVFDDALQEEEADRTFAVAAQLSRRSASDGSVPRIGNIPDAPVTVILEIDEQSLILPQAELTVTGRGNASDNGNEAYLDLSPFDARENGVSRHHARFMRKDMLVYVADLGSTNGTFLNGRRLLVNVERLLRNGDELQLGSLKLKVKYS